MNCTSIHFRDDDKQNDCISVKILRKCPKKEVHLSDLPTEYSSLFQGISGIPLSGPLQKLKSGQVRRWGVVGVGCVGGGPL